VEGGLQRALVIYHDTMDYQPAKKRKRKKSSSKFNPLWHSKYDELCIDELHDHDNDEDDDDDREHDDDVKAQLDPPATMQQTFSFDSWLRDLQTQRHQMLNRSKERNRKYLQRKQQQLAKQPITDKQTLSYLYDLRNDLPFNPDKLQQMVTEYETTGAGVHSLALQTCPPAAEQDIDIDATQNDVSKIYQQIELINQKIFLLQIQANELKQIEQSKGKLQNWKEFQLLWYEWRLIDFYEYLLRINYRKYAKYVLNFELFYQHWMDIYRADESNEALANARFSSHIFVGRNLLYFDHRDLEELGIKMKTDRREIIMGIQRLNRLSHCKQI